MRRIEKNENKAQLAKEKIPIRLAQRLPVYYRLLKELADQGVARISATELGIRVGITPVQLRQDLSYFGSFGQQGYGYRVDDLVEAFSQMLGIDRRFKLILVGAGNLGKALANYEGFRRRGYQFVAIFDDGDVIGSRVGVLEVQPVSELSDYLRSHQVDIGVLTLPSQATQEIADILVSQGVKAIWSFAPVRLQVPADVFVEHIHLSDSLMSLAFRLHASETGHSLEDQ